jgi:hypothetical protein
VPKRKTTFYVDEDVLRAAEVMAARKGKRDSDIFEEALRQYVGFAARRELAFVGDPLEQLIGLVGDADGPDDVAENHDHYLYGASRQSQEPSK